MESSRGIFFLFYFAFLFAVFVGSAVANVVCVQEEHEESRPTCICVMSDKSGRYDLTALSGTSDEPFFPNIKGRNSSESFAFDPCVSFTLAGSKGSCEAVAGCRREVSSSGTSYFAIANHNSVEFLFVSKQLILKYTNAKLFQPITTEIILKCSRNSDVSFVNLVKATDSAVLMELHSPQACLIAPGTEGLSAGSVLCIIFSLSVIAYIVGGVLFLVFVQNKPLNEAIPNKGFWMELPGLIIDGAKFASNGFKPIPATHQRLGNEDIDDDDDDDDEENIHKAGTGGAPSGQSDGFTAVPV